MYKDDRYSPLPHWLADLIIKISRLLLIKKEIEEAKIIQGAQWNTKIGRLDLLFALIPNSSFARICDDFSSPTLTEASPINMQ